MGEIGVWRSSPDGGIVSFGFVTEQRPGIAEGVETRERVTHDTWQCRWRVFLQDSELGWVAKNSAFGVGGIECGLTELCAQRHGQMGEQAAADSPSLKNRHHFHPANADPSTALLECALLDQRGDFTCELHLLPFSVVAVGHLLPVLVLMLVTMWGHTWHKRGAAGEPTQMELQGSFCVTEPSQDPCCVIFINQFSS